MNSPTTFFRLSGLIFGVFCCSTAVIFIKLTEVDPFLLAFLRLLISAVILLPLFLRDLSQHRDSYSWGHVRLTILPAFFLSAHFLTWIVGARMIPAAHSTLIVNLVPVFMPFYVFFLLKENITRNEIIGTFAAVLGGGILAGADAQFHPEALPGDLLCFISMLFFTAYLALARKNGAFPTLWLYVTPLYFVSSLMCLGVALFTFDAWLPISPLDMFYAFCLAVIPTIIGHSLLNRAMSWFRGQLVAIFNLGQFIFAGLVAWIVMRDVPSLAFYPASLLILAGALIVTDIFKAHWFRSLFRREAEVGPE